MIKLWFIYTCHIKLRQIRLDSAVDHFLECGRHFLQTPVDNTLHKLFLVSQELHVLTDELVCSLLFVSQWFHRN